MKIQITKNWFRSRADLEEGLEIGAGSLQHVGKPALRVLSASTPVDQVTFGQTISLMRRKRGWTVDRLAREAETTPDELTIIEANPEFVPELSTVFSLAKTFDLPAKVLIHKAGLADVSSCNLHEDSVRYAACSEFKEPLSAEEEQVLQAVLEAIVEQSDDK